MKTLKVLKMFSVVALMGCTHLRRTETKLSRTLAEESRALTTGVVDVLQLEPPEERDRFTEAALEFARQDQRIEGLPVKPFDMRAVVGVGEGLSGEGGTNGVGWTEASARKKLGTTWKSVEGALSLPSEVKRRFAFQDRLRAREFAVQEKLVDFGATHEEERNARIWAWTKWLGGGSFLVGGLVALCVFFPVAIPIVGRVLAWLVGKAPSMAGAVGVVSTKAFDAVVSAIEQTKAMASAGKSGSGERIGNESGSQSSEVDELLLNLSKAMDGEHKALVRRRKGAMGVA